MQCYECASRNTETPAVGICRHCMVGLCLHHLADSQRSFTSENPGTGCKHQPLSDVPEQAAMSSTPIGIYRSMRS